MFYSTAFSGERPPANVQGVGVPGDDGATALGGDIPLRGGEAGPSLRKYDGVECAYSRPAARHHDVLPRLRSRTFQAYNTIV